ncbi:SseB family protein [Microbacterium neungamense]|uniref:SseB family protein n=1 Tax=Microbacterium neungamense TaxID=2810535 RepID=UPI00217D379D|nr:SseB family protein [Microbacterium neungamense]UWF77587.1 SseB family protein [Microbacterium neungamense]
MSDHRKAIPAVERAILGARQGTLTPETALWALAAAEVYFLAEDEPKGASLPESPVLLEREGHQFLAVFTSGDAMTTYLTGKRAAVRINGFELLQRIPPSVGVVVNPGADAALELPAQGLAEFVHDVRNTPAP